MAAAAANGGSGDKSSRNERGHGGQPTDYK
jgi:hypothetical protein